MKKINTAILHFCICAVFLFFPYLISSDGGAFHFPDFNDGHDRTFLGVYFLLLAFFYVHYYVLIPKLYFRKDFAAYFLIVVAAGLFFLWFSVFLNRPMEVFLSDAHRPVPPPDIMFYRNHMGMPPSGPPPMQIEHTLMVFIVGVIGSLLLSINKRLRATENDKVQAELLLLKAQINPHFLFNTLNNIYALALTNDGRTADSVIQLSEIMRYIMENAHEDIISLSQEISYLNNYISLQKSRLGDTTRISYRVDGDLGGRSVAPLILISFIENAFKHGVNPDENSEIDIQISVTETQLTLLVFNKKVSTVQTESGLGMRNTVKRLELLYPDRHRLLVSETEESYTVELMLQL